MFNLVMKIIFIIAIALIFMGLWTNYNQKPDPKVIYRYVPRSFVEDQENPVPLNDLFYDMFNRETPWVGTIDVDRRKEDVNEEIEKFYVAEI